MGAGSITYYAENLIKNNNAKKHWKKKKKIKK
jgi:hypothetical protein